MKGELLRGSKFAPVVRAQKRQKRGFELLRLADVLVGEVVELIVAHPESVCQTQFGDFLRAAQDQRAVRLIEERVEIQALQTCLDAGDGGLA